MNQRRVVVALLAPLSGGFILFSGGCRSNVHKASFIDLAPLVQSTSHRLALAASPEPRRPLAVVVVGEKAQETRIADWWSYLGEPVDKRSYMGDTVAAMGFADNIIYHLEARESLGVYVAQAVTMVVESKGFEVMDNAPKRLVVTLDDFWLDNASSNVVRVATVGAGIQVVDATAANVYTRGIRVESAFSSDQSHASVTGAGMAMAFLVGIGPSGEGMRKKADAEASLAALGDVIAKFQDELAADVELWDALR